jgi:hypothetical protein
MADENPLSIAERIYSANVSVSENERESTIEEKILFRAGIYRFKKT